MTSYRSRSSEFWPRSTFEMRGTHNGKTESIDVLATICIEQINAQPISTQIKGVPLSRPTELHDTNKLINWLQPQFREGVKGKKHSSDTETVAKFITKKGITKSHINLCTRVCVSVQQQQKHWDASIKTDFDISNDSSDDNDAWNEVRMRWSLLLVCVCVQVCVVYVGRLIVVVIFAAKSIHP